MNKIKKIVFGTCFMCVGSMLFAQNLPNLPVIQDLESPKSLTGLVSEVDNYMNVNSYKSVEFDKVFGSIGYSDVFNAGAATYFGNIYTGFYFNGDFFKSQSTNKTVTSNDKDPSDNEYTTTEKSSGSQSLNTNQFQFSTLIGVAGFGIKPSIAFKPGDSAANVTNKSSLSDTLAENGSDYKSKSTKKSYSLRPQVDVGYNLFVGKYALSPRAFIGFEFDPKVDNSEIEGKIAGVQGTQKTTSVNSTNWFIFGFGSGVDLPNKENSIVSTSFGTDFGFYLASRKISSSQYQKVDADVVTDISSSTSAKGNKLVTWNLDWQSVVEPNDKVTLKFKGGIPFSWLNTNDEEKTTSTVTTPEETQTNVSYKDLASTKTVSTSIKPNVGAWISYKPKKNVTFMTGAEVLLPYIEFIKSTTEEYDTTDEERKLVKTTKSSTNTFNNNDEGDFNIKWESGFRVDITPAIVLDCEWNIVGDLFTNFSQNSLKGQPFWDGLGDVVYHDLKLQLSIKL